MRKILLVGSHSCSNRGDMAILRGLVRELRSPDYRTDLTILSREYQSSNILFEDHELVPDILQGEVKSFRNKLIIRAETFISFVLYIFSKHLARLLLSPRQRKYAKMLKEHDFVLQVGGSFLVDHYGVSQFEYMLLALILDKRIYLVGHSYGPFRTLRSRIIARYLLKRVHGNYYREPNSKSVLEGLGVPKIKRGADTAWLISENEVAQGGHKKIGLTLRDLYPFDKDLGVTQLQFEEKAANLIDALNSEGYDVEIYSTCTGFGGYWKDDRIVGFKVKKRVKDQSKVSVYMNDINDVDLGKEIQSCDLLLGTRLHSAIIAMTFGVPAFTIYYEHKSLGIVERVLDSNYCIKIQDLDSDKILNRVKETLGNLEELRAKLATSVTAERDLAAKMIEDVMIKENCF